MTRDDIYSLPMNRVGQFQFDEQVVQVFPDMIARSVPGYASILSMIEQLAGRFVRPGTNVWDLGCSLGARAMDSQLLYALADFGYFINLLNLLPIGMMGK